MLTYGEPLSRMASSVEVNALVVDAIGKSVFSVTGVPSFPASP